MTIISPTFPPDVKILLNAIDLEDIPGSSTLRMHDDLFIAVIESRNKILSVGWFPEFNPAGNYHVQLLSGRYAEQLIEEKVVGTPQEVVVILEEFAKFHDETQIHPCQ